VRAFVVERDQLPIASCTATSVTVSIIDVRVTTAVAIVVRIDCASAALPTMLCESSPSSLRWSIAIVTSERTMPVRKAERGNHPEPLREPVGNPEPTHDGHVTRGTGDKQPKLVSGTPR
jgi:hypothetical protein